MTEQDTGLRREGEHVGADGTTHRNATSALSAQEGQTWSVVAHLSVLAALVGLMPLGALMVWLIYKDRSPRVGFHALQALWYQIAWLVILVAYVLVTVVLSIVTLGLAAIVLVPLALLVGLIPLVHGCYAAYKVSQGVDYRYPYIADRIDGGARRVF
jgi:uncharacterized protein